MRKQYYFESITQKIEYPYHVLTTTSPRKILFVINLLLAVCSICLAGFAIFLCQLLYDEKFTSGWIIWMGMAVVSICIASVSVIGLRGAHMVSLDLLLTYFWGVIVFVAPLLLALFACFNFYIYTAIWFRHQWSTITFQRIRELFCVPSNTYNGKCIAPLSESGILLYDDDGLQYYIAPDGNATLCDSFSNSTDCVDYTTTWCKYNYNATDCADIRDSAIARAVDWGGRVIAAQSAVGFVCLLIIAWSIYTSQRILTSPVITQSMLDVINYLLLLPIAGCIALAIYFWWIRSLDLDQTFLPDMFLALAIAQIIALPLGITAGRMKSRPLLIGYIVVLVFIALGFAAAGGVGWTLANSFENFTPSNATLYEIACRKELPGCSGCEQSPQTCPEWRRSEVMTLISLDLRLAGMVAILSILYIFGGLIVASLVDNSLKNYKTDFI